MRRAQSTGCLPPSVSTRPRDSPSDHSDENREITREMVRDYWRQFCVGTPIHGVKYLVAEDRPIYERLWWMGVLATTLYFATTYSIELYIRLTREPMDLNIQTVTKYEDIRQVPFPAITICDNMKSPEPRFIKNETTSFLCGQFNDSPTMQTYKIDVESLFQVSPPFRCECKISHNHLPKVDNFFSYCNRMFTKVLTMHGVCYSFNMLDKTELFMDGVHSHYSSHGRRSDWDPVRGYAKDTPIADANATDDPLHLGPYPKRAISSVLTLRLWPGTHGTYCDRDLPGFKVAVHNPVDLPRMGHLDNVWVPVMGEEFDAFDYMKIDIGNEIPKRIGRMKFCGVLI